VAADEVGAADEVAAADVLVPDVAVAAVLPQAASSELPMTPPVATRIPWITWRRCTGATGDNSR
jgi:hypothetical protein